MPTNQQRREAAKRKLERQLVRRQQQERRRRQRLLVVGVVAAVLVVSGAVWLIFADHSSPSTSEASGADATSTLTSGAPTTPCSYPASGTAAKAVSAPDNLSPLNSGTVQAEITLNGSAVPITLDRATAPCGVNAFLSLAQQGFYNDTTCWRLTKSPGLNVLQCGDPSGQGNGGPGYSYASEPPTGNVDPTTGQSTGDSYPVGTIALANAGASDTGSQFFIVYGDSPGLTPQYTVLGKVDGNGMDVIQQIAAGGTANGAQDGAPATTATISKVVVPEDALQGSGTYATPSASTDVPGLDPSAVDGGAAPTDASSDPATGSPEASAPETSAPASS